MHNDLYSEYIRETEPDKKYKSYLWATAIGLQKVDNLKTSEFLNEVARANIEGEITLDEVKNRVNKYYRSTVNKPEKILTEEGDKVAANIVGVLSENAFSLTPNEYISIHRKLFNGVLKRAGQIRDYNITKEEWVLGGETVIYGTASELKATLEYDISKEKNFSYKDLTTEETINHLADFISHLWQIHIFEEGNTRTTSVFLIKYLRTLGYDVSNDIFSQNARYFRNALVRANYSNLNLKINKTTEYLKIFFRNVLMHENNELKSRYLHIDKNFVKYLREIEKDKKVDIQDKKVDIQDKKVDIQDKKVDIQDKKVDIQDKKVDIQDLSTINKFHVDKMFMEFGNEKIFGRTDAGEIIGLKPAGTSKLLKILLEKGIIEPVKGHGKGKYKFAL